MNPIYSHTSLDALPHPEEVHEMLAEYHNQQPSSQGGGGGYGTMAENNINTAVHFMHSPMTSPSGHQQPQFPSLGGGGGGFTSPPSYGSLGDLSSLQWNGRGGGGGGNSFGPRASGILTPQGSPNNNNPMPHHHHQFHQRTGTVAGVTMNTLCNVMGAGVLALPLAVHNGSVVMSLLLLMLSAYVSLKAVHILGIGCDSVHRYSFTECVVLSLFPAPIQERRDCIVKGIDPMLNSKPRLITTLLLEFVIVIESFGTLVVYARVIADSMPPLLTGLGLPTDEHPFATLFLSWVLPAAVFFILSCSRSMEELKWTSLIGFGTILYIVLVVVYKYFEFVYDSSPIFDPPVDSSSSSAASLATESPSPMHFFSAIRSWIADATVGGGLVLHTEGIRWFALDWGCFATMSTYSLAFGYHFNVPYFYSELRDRTPPNLLKTVYYALPIVSLSYALTGVLGYLQVGPSVAGRGGGNIVDRLDTTSFLVNLGRVGLLFHFATVYPVISVCARRGLHRFIALLRLCIVPNGLGVSDDHTAAGRDDSREQSRGEATDEHPSVPPHRADSASSSAARERDALLWASGTNPNFIGSGDLPPPSGAKPKKSLTFAPDAPAPALAATTAEPSPASPTPSDDDDDAIEVLSNTQPVFGAPVGSEGSSPKTPAALGSARQQEQQQQQQQVFTPRAPSGPHSTTVPRHHLPPRRTMPPRTANFSVNSFSNLPTAKAPPVPGDPNTTTRQAIVLEAAFIVLMGTVCAWFVPGVGLVIEVLGAFFGIPTQMIIPGIIGMKLFNERSGYANRWWMSHVSKRPEEAADVTVVADASTSGVAIGPAPTSPTTAAVNKGMRREYRIAVLLIIIGVVCTVFGVARTVSNMLEGEGDEPISSPGHGSRRHGRRGAAAPAAGADGSSAAPAVVESAPSILGGHKKGTTKGSKK